MLLLSLVRLALALMFYCHFVLAGYEQIKKIKNSITLAGSELAPNQLV